MTAILSLRPARPFMLALLALATLASVAAIACSKGNEAAAPLASPTPNVAPLAIGVRQGDLGAFLTGPDGKTLYVFTRDLPNMSNCTEDCIATWPPLLIKDGQAIKADGAPQGAFDRISTPSGMQVTFNGAPLYFYAGDGAPGETSGHKVAGVWFVARPDTASTAVVGVRGAGNAAFLVGPSGLTLYVFAKDSNGVSNCSGQCIENWPALTVPEGFTPDAVDAAHGALDVLKRRDDGTFQVTYGGMPLYYFAADKLPGDTKGDGVGGVWSIARP